MSTLEATLRFISTYPGWAKVLMLGGLLLCIGVMLLAPRTPIEAQAQSKPGTVTTAPKAVQFKILGVSLDRAAGGGAKYVRVYAVVNGKQFIYPSLGGVDWVQIGPLMAPSQYFTVPAAAQYDLRFEMEVKGGLSRHLSQEVVQITTLPFTGHYRLYATMTDDLGLSRSGTPRAIVHFSIEPPP